MKNLAPIDENEDVITKEYVDTNVSTIILSTLVAITNSEIDLIVAS